MVRLRRSSGADYGDPVFPEFLAHLGRDRPLRLALRETDCPALLPSLKHTPPEARRPLSAGPTTHPAPASYSTTRPLVGRRPMAETLRLSIAGASSSPRAAGEIKELTLVCSRPRCADLSGEFRPWLSEVEVSARATAVGRYVATPADPKTV
jgi:hypothetical protein